MDVDGWLDRIDGWVGGWVDGLERSEEKRREEKRREQKKREIDAFSGVRHPSSSHSAPYLVMRWKSSWREREREICFV